MKSNIHPACQAFCYYVPIPASPPLYPKQADNFSGIHNDAITGINKPEKMIEIPCNWLSPFWHSDERVHS
jgi:hypothetical protein